MEAGEREVSQMVETLSIFATGLTKCFGDFTAVDDLSLSIRAGEIYGFLGLNGAGKTTTIRMLLGMLRPSVGSVLLFGSEVKPGRQDIWRQVGYLVETPHAYPDLTVSENLDIVRRLRHLNDDDAVRKVIEELGLTQYTDRKAMNLSLGNAQRLGLAKALIHHPDLLILDEPANEIGRAHV
jgi:ABC-2 type transport system ATP-binding protein